MPLEWGKGEVLGRETLGETAFFFLSYTDHFIFCNAIIADLCLNASCVPLSCDFGFMNFLF